MKVRLDNLLVERKLAASRSQAANYINLGKVFVSRDEKIWLKAKKSGEFVDAETFAKIEVEEQFVSRAALKLQSVAKMLELDFRDQIVLDIGSSTGGFTDFALSCGAEKVIAVDVGTDQLHPKLRADARVELHEKTDIRDFRVKNKPDIILADVSFISLREILPYVAQYLANQNTQIVAMVKPQFESGSKIKNAGVIKNDTERRKILKDFENWAKKLFIIEQKADSKVAGAKGNVERFYLLKKIK